MQLSIVVPCYNEELVLNETAARLRELLAQLTAQGKLASSSAVYFVDDGSNDGTWALIERLAQEFPCIHGIKLARNRGHQLALLAGLMTVGGDAVITIDADLQDDLGAIDEMISAFAAGSDIVYGVRSDRRSDVFLKRWTAERYYALLARLGVEVVFNHADYRLLSRRVIDALSQYSEVNVFLRGLIPQIGFRTSIVRYERAARFAGESKYPLHKMLALAWDGVTSFSAVPLRMITKLGFLISLGSLAVGLWALGIRLMTDRAVPGWASTVTPIYFLGGVQLLSIGIIGEYLAKTYLESKRRPRFIIDKTV